MNTTGWIAGASLVALAFMAMFLLVRARRLARLLALRERSGDLFKPFYDLPFIGMAITSPATRRWEHVNDRLCAILGYSREELSTKTWAELTHPEDLGKDVAEFDRVMRGESEDYAMDKRFVRKDGSVLFASIDIRCVRARGGVVDHFVATVQDVTERTAAEAKVRKVSRLYLTLSRCNAAIVHCANEDALFAEICRAAVESGGMAMAWVGAVDPLTGAVLPVASFGDGVDYLDTIRISVDGREPHGRGPSGTAIRNNEPYWCQDFRNDPRTAPWHELGARFGWGALASLPLRRGGAAVGVFTLYTAEPDAFDEETRALLTQIASDTSAGMEKFERDAARARIEEHLVESEERYRLLFDNSHDAILVTTPDGRILSANPSARKAFGRSEHELQDTGRDSLVDLTDPRLEAALEERKRTGKYSGELTLLRRNGDKFPAEVSSTVFVQRSGDVRTSMFIHDITERKRAEEQLAHFSHYDVLTDLPNRLLLVDRLNVAIALAQRSGKRFALLHIDLDRFKNVNDSFGHAFGDRLLRKIAERLAGCVRESDTLSRQGGDEFIVILPQIDTEQDAARVAQKILDAISLPFALDASEILLTGSVGIACFPENGHDAESLLRNADAAMYSAKDEGRARYAFHSAGMYARAHERLVLEGELRRAVEREQLFLAYQPQVDLLTGAVIGLEALVRWRHPVRGVVPPAQFIAIAEDSGLIASIGAWVLESACGQHAAWLRAGLIAGPVAVNVSAYQFRQRDFVDVVTRVLSRTGLQPKFLELELTESAVMHGIDEVLEKLGHLHRLGVKLAVDDFGTGYSSLSYLKQFPIYRLKIDQSFTRGLPGDRDSSAIARAIISLGHSLRLDVLAEGIETREQEDHLRALRCDSGQGYLYAKPMPVDECTRYLELRAKSPATKPEPA